MHGDRKGGLTRPDAIHDFKHVYAVYLRLRRYLLLRMKGESNLFRVANQVNLNLHMLMKSFPKVNRRQGLVYQNISNQDLNLC